MATAAPAAAVAAVAAATVAAAAVAAAVVSFCIFLRCVAALHPSRGGEQTSSLRAAALRAVYC